MCVGVCVCVGVYVLWECMCVEVYMCGECVCVYIIILVHRPIHLEVMSLFQLACRKEDRGGRRRT